METGIWRSGTDGRMAITIALPRLSEVSEGTIEEGRIRLLATSVRRASGGSGLTAVRRDYDVDGDEIDYHVWMATEGVTELTHHLHGSLRREHDPA